MWNTLLLGICRDVISDIYKYILCIFNYITIKISIVLRLFSTLDQTFDGRIKTTSNNIFKKPLWQHVYLKFLYKKKVYSLVKCILYRENYVSLTAFVT